MATIQLTVPDEILESIDTARQATGESRNAFVCRAVEDYLRSNSERQKIEQYIRGYTEHPETTEELESATGLAHIGYLNVAWEVPTNEQITRVCPHQERNS